MELLRKVISALLGAVLALIGFFLISTAYNSAKWYITKIELTDFERNLVEEIRSAVDIKGRELGRIPTAQEVWSVVDSKTNKPQPNFHDGQIIESSDFDWLVVYVYGNPPAGAFTYTSFVDGFYLTYASWSDSYTAIPIIEPNQSRKLSRRWFSTSACLISGLLLLVWSGQIFWRVLSANHSLKADGADAPPP